MLGAAHQLIGLLLDLARALGHHFFQPAILAQQGLARLAQQQMIAYPRQQHRRGKRFVHKVLGTERQGVGFVGATVQAGQENDRDIPRQRPCLEPAAQRIAIRHRHDDVQQDKIGLATLFEILKQIVPTVEHLDVVIQPEAVLKNEQVIRLIINGKYPVFHLNSPSHPDSIAASWRTPAAAFPARPAKHAQAPVFPAVADAPQC